MKLKFGSTAAMLSLLLHGVAGEAAATTAATACEELAAFTAEVAASHQSEVPLSAVLDVVKRNSDPVYVDAATRIVITIYAEPRYRTPENQQHFIAEWRDRAHVGCLQNAGQRVAAPEEPS